MQIQYNAITIQCKYNTMQIQYKANTIHCKYNLMQIQYKLYNANTIQCKYNTMQIQYNANTYTMQIQWAGKFSPPVCSKNNDNVWAMRWVTLCLALAVTYKHCLSSKKTTKMTNVKNLVKETLSDFYLRLISKHCALVLLFRAISGGWEANWGLMRTGWGKPFSGIKVKTNGGRGGSGVQGTVCEDRHHPWSIDHRSSSLIAFVLWLSRVQSHLVQRQKW